MSYELVVTRKLLTVFKVYPLSPIKRILLKGHAHVKRDSMFRKINFIFNGCQYRVGLDAKAINEEMIKEDITDSEELRPFIVKNISNPELFKAPIYFKKETLKTSGPAPEN